MTAPIRIAVEFDGVIHQNTSSYHGLCTIPDPPVDGAIEWLRETLANGATVFIHSHRVGHTQIGVGLADDFIRAWFLCHGLPPDDIERLELSYGRPHADVYISTRAWRFNGRFPAVEELRAVDVPRFAAVWTPVVDRWNLYPVASLEEGYGFVRGVKAFGDELCAVIPDDLSDLDEQDRLEVEEKYRALTSLES